MKPPFCQVSGLMISIGVNVLRLNESLQLLVLKKRRKRKQKKKKREKEKKNAARIFLMKEEIITAHVYVINRVLSTRTKKICEMSRFAH